MVLFVGRLVPGKGVFELLQAGRSLLQKRSNLQLVYLGEGPVQEELEARASAEGIRSHVSFPGTCDSAGVVRWLAAADVFALPSYAEGCPNVVIEALHCGRPVVATNVGAIPELVDDHCGILIPARNTEALAAALDAAFGRIWDQNEIAVHCRRTWDDVAREFLAVCDAVVQSCQPSFKASGRAVRGLEGPG